MFVVGWLGVLKRRGVPTSITIPLVQTQSQEKRARTRVYRQRGRLIEINRVDIYKCIHTHTHTHTHIYIYLSIYLSIYISMYLYLYI